jgi:hypothetical protein
MPGSPANVDHLVRADRGIRRRLQAVDRQRPPGRRRAGLAEPLPGWIAPSTPCAGRRRRSAGCSAPVRPRCCAFTAPMFKVAAWTPRAWRSCLPASSAAPSAMTRCCRTPTWSCSPPPPGAASARPPDRAQPVRRPAYRQLLADIEAGAVDAVIVWALDRLHRRPAELERFFEVCDRAGVTSWPTWLATSTWAPTTAASTPASWARRQEERQPMPSSTANVQHPWASQGTQYSSTWRGDRRRTWLASCGGHGQARSSPAVSSRLTSRHRCRPAPPTPGRSE